MPALQEFGSRRKLLIIAFKSGSECKGSTRKAPKKHQKSTRITSVPCRTLGAAGGKWQKHQIAPKSIKIQGKVHKSALSRNSAVRSMLFKGALFDAFLCFFWCFSSRKNTSVFGPLGGRIKRGAGRGAACEDQEGVREAPRKASGKASEKASKKAPEKHQKSTRRVQEP